MRRFVRPRIFPIPPSNEPGNDDNFAEPPIGPEPFYPTLDNVLKVRYLLRHKVGWCEGKEKGLPVEIVDMIVDEAEYWPSVEKRMSRKSFIGQDRDRSLVRTAPLCYDEEALETDPASAKPLPHRTARPCRKIIFRISSHDQGWGGSNRGGHIGSWTWFDAVVIRSAYEKIRNSATSSTEHENNSSSNDNDNDNDNNDDDTDNNDDIEEPSFPTNYGEMRTLMLQSNKTAVRTTEPYTIVWHYQDNIPPDSAEAEEIENNEGRGRTTLDGRTVRELQVGDSISVWARARFGGWSNHVEWLSVRVFWVV